MTWSPSPDLLNLWMEKLRNFRTFSFEHESECGSSEREEHRLAVLSLFAKRKRDQGLAHARSPTSDYGIRRMPQTLRALIPVDRTPS